MVDRVISYLHNGNTRSHEYVRNVSLVSTIARILDFPQRSIERISSGDSLYMVSNHCLVQNDVAPNWRISGPEHIFGGVVPERFVSTKSIMHGLVKEMAHRPARWSSALERVAERCTLPGYTVFSLQDAHEAGTRLLALGHIRIKDPLANGGHSQWIATSTQEVYDILRRHCNETYNWQAGLVMELNLSEATTRSVGHVQIGGHYMSYYGRQHHTINNAGESDYGGTDIVAMRGSFIDLFQSPLPFYLTHAVEMVMHFDEAVTEAFPDAIISRHNYDIIEGFDSRGIFRSGILEQSYRIGGASSAEVAAVYAFAEDPALVRVYASSKERYGGREIPSGATIHFDGIDPDMGRMQVYTTIGKKAYE